MTGPGPAEIGLTEAERMALLAVARAAVCGAVEGRAPPALPADLPPRLREPAGAFVSLHAGTALRGCIGSVAPEGSLVQLVARMAAAAATGDPRFPPLRPDELAEVTLAVSVLSPAQPMAPDDLAPTRHGVCLRLGRRSSVLLPQVAARHRWDRGALLAHLCEKAGLEPGAWRDPDAVLLGFAVEAVEGRLVIR